jgi:hypothetical protein
MNLVKLPLAARGGRTTCRVLASIVVVLAVASCSSGGLDAPAISQASGDKVAPTPAGFVSHTDPTGFTLQRPQDWQVAVQSLNDIVVASPTGTAAALIRARVVKGDLVKWVAGTYMGTEAGVQSFQAISSSSGGANVARALVRYVDSANNEKRASVVAVRAGELATVFTAVGPVAEFANILPTLTQILDSFRFAPVTTANTTGAALRYVQWVDPFESAWSMEVPAGWQSTGGLLRRADGVRAVWQLTAPGGTTLIFGGDATVPSFFVFPTQTALSLGFREGEPTGPNGPIMLRFQEAAAMGPGIFQQRYGQAQVVTVRERPDLIEVLQRNPLLQGNLPRMSAAEIEFRLADGRVGVMALTTSGAEVANLGGTWRVDHIHGFIAPADRVGEAGAALAHAIATTRENPEWRRGESALQADLAARWQEYLNFSNNLQRQTIEARWASDAAINRQRRDVLGGTVRLVDPQTGETFEASGQNRYYFRVAGQGGTVGTDTDFNPAPNLDLRRLLQVGVDAPDR